MPELPGGTDGWERAQRVDLQAGNTHASPGQCQGGLGGPAAWRFLFAPLPPQSVVWGQGCYEGPSAEFAMIKTWLLPSGQALPGTGAPRRPCLCVGTWSPADFGSSPSLAISKLCGHLWTSVPICKMVAERLFLVYCATVGTEPHRCLAHGRSPVQSSPLDFVHLSYQKTQGHPCPFRPVRCPPESCLPDKFFLLFVFSLLLSGYGFWMG